MAEFSFLAYYKDHSSDKLPKDQGFSYAKFENRQRFQSLTPVMEHEMPEENQKAKRRFSLDAIFSKKKKEFKLPKDVRRNTTASTTSIDSTSSKSSSRRSSSSSLKPSHSKAEIAAWVFS